MSDWIEWNGGECPVDEGDNFEIKFRSGKDTQSSVNTWRWAHVGDETDIVAYRIIDEPNPESKKNDTDKPNKYMRRYSNRMLKRGEGEFDVYDVLVAFGVTCPMRQHAIKKLLAAGQRNGGKSELQDLQEALQSIEEAIKEKGK